MTNRFDKLQIKNLTTSGKEDKGVKGALIIGDNVIGRFSTPDLDKGISRVKIFDEELSEQIENYYVKKYDGSLTLKEHIYDMVLNKDQEEAKKKLEDVARDTLKKFLKNGADKYKTVAILQVKPNGVAETTVFTAKTKSRSKFSKAIEQTARLRAQQSDSIKTVAVWYTSPRKIEALHFENQYAKAQ